MTAFEAIALAAALAAVAMVGGFTLLTGVPPLPTSPVVRRTLLAMLPAEVPGPIAELGSGWGGLARALASRYPDRRVVGYELSPLPYLVARARQALRPRANLECRRADFMAADLSGFGLVVCYLLPARMAELEGKLERELAAGALVASNFFALPHWRPRETRTASDLWSSPVYLYAVPSADPTEETRPCP